MKGESNLIISFEVSPLVNDVKTGIGYCESGQVTEISKAHSGTDRIKFEFFSLRNHDRKLARIEPYLMDNCEINMSRFSGFVYKAVSTFIPLPYSWFFGKGSDITHFFNYIVPPFVHGKKVVTIHDMVYKAFPETMNSKTRILLNLAMNKSMKRADAVVTDSEFSRSEIIKYFPQYRDKVEVVPCGVDCDMFKPIQDRSIIEKVKANHNIKGKYFLYLGTLEPRKNLTRLVKAYEILSRRKEDCPLLVLAGGKGWLYDEIFEEVNKSGLGDKVIFTQYIPGEEICPLMNGAEAFVFPSLYEGFGMPPLEAMACGTPVIVSGSASLPEVVGDCGLIVDAYSEESIADAMGKIADNEELRKQLSEKGIIRAREFSWKKSAEKLYTIYERLVQQ
jgi:glycosyltransferase involved in cell wall biosynthesis